MADVLLGAAAIMLGTAVGNGLAYAIARGCGWLPVHRG